MEFFDAHTHVQFAVYDKDRDSVIRRALEAGVGMVNVGTTQRTSEAAVKLAEQHPGFCFAAIGVHPSHASVSEYQDPDEMAAGGEERFDFEFYKNLTARPGVLAVGECGLDYFRISDKTVREKQRDLFEKQIAFANDIKKPLMIHCRGAFPDLIEILNSKSEILHSPPGIVHFFAGTRKEAGELLDLGFSFTFGGVITFTRDYDEIIRTVPLDRILSETDAPYVTPVPYRGKRNEPVYVVEVVKKLAEIKSISIEEMNTQILKNAEKVFGITFHIP